MKRISLMHFKLSSLKGIKVVLLVFLFLVFSRGSILSGQSQARYSIKFENTTIEASIKMMQIQFGLNFFYNSESLNQESKRVNKSMVNSTSDEIMKVVLEGTNLSHSFVNNVIIIANEKTLNNASKIDPKSSTVVVNGIVVDKKGLPIIAANIKLVGTKFGTYTDFNGIFTIKMPADGVLEVSAISYKTRQIVLNGANHLVITIEDDEIVLSELVVVGYGTVKKENLTGAVSSINASVLEDRPNSNIAKSIQGVMPNVNVSFTDGRPGRSASINIRGLSVMTGNGTFEETTPFILIDGVPGDINSVNPNDVESISVLKDAASASIYGARGAYGVILIKTKAGNVSTKTIVNASVNYSYSSPLKVPEIITDPYTVMSIKNEAMKNYNNTSMFLQYRLDYAKALEVDPSLPKTVVGANGVYEYYYSTDWYRELYAKTSPQFRANVSLSGGSESIQYYLSMGYSNQEGVYNYNPDTYSRYKLNAKITIRPNKYLNIYNYTDGTRAENDFPTWFGDNINVWRYMELVTTSLAPMYNPDGTLSRQGFIMGYLKDGGRGLKEEIKIRNTTGFVLTPAVKNLNIKGDFTYSYNAYDQNERFKRIKSSEKQNVDEYYKGINRAKETRSYENYIVFNLYADYEINFSKHNLTALAGMNYEKSSTNYYWAQRDDVVSDSYSALNLATGVMNVSQKITEWAVNGYFGRLKYNYDNRYLIEFNSRYDMTSRFPRASRGGFFPSASAAWRIDKEKFMEYTSDWLSEFKIRASYGSLGNQQVENYSFFELLSSSQITTILGTERPLTVSTPALLPTNPTWEKSSTIDFGVDLGFLNQKVKASFDYYITDIKDMLTKGKTLPSVIGASEPKENAADLRTKGWDLIISYNNSWNILNSPFSLNSSFILSDSYTDVTKFDNPSNILSQFYVGQRLGEIWGLETLGFFKGGDDLTSINQSRYQMPAYTAGPGDLKWKDQNGDNIINNGSNTLSDPGDFIKIGNSLSRYNYGVSISIKWYGFNIDALFQGVGKKDYYPGAEAAYFWSVYNRPANSVAKHLIGNYWTPENPDAYFPKMRGYLAMSTTRAMGVKQTQFLQDASFLRFKNLTIGYTIPQKITNRLGIGRARIYFSGENLATFTKLHKAFDPEGTKIDPDTADWGEGLAYPMARTFSFGIDLNL